MDKPAMAESTLVKGTDMVCRVYLIKLETGKGFKMRWGNILSDESGDEWKIRRWKKGRRKEEGKAGDQGCVRGGPVSWMSCYLGLGMFVSYKQGSTLFLLYPL